MKRSIYLLLFLITLLLIPPPTFAAGPPAKGYGSSGTVWITNDGYPPYDTFKKEMFDKRGNEFFVKGGPGAKLFLRIINSGLKPNQHFLDRVTKKYTKKKVQLKEAQRCIYIWVSHTGDGKKLRKTAPKTSWVWQGEWSLEPWSVEVAAKRSADSKTAPIFHYCFSTYAESLAWTAWGLRWQHFKENRWGFGQTAFQSWLERAKPGYKFWVFASVGFKRHYPKKERYEPKKTIRIIPWVNILHDPPVAMSVGVIK